ncbi:MAG: transporter substrate-binding domain-containing protein, partial [Desulforhopalus sp.]|nr:transporter substrate-binding domain-containing protein [Desulforhopalus sp.]
MSGLAVFIHLKSSQVFTCLGRLLCFVGRRNSKPSIKIIPFLIILLLLSITLSAWAEESSRIQLTPAEKAWLTAHPEVVLGAPTDYPPMVIKRKDGTHVGVLVDFFEETSKVLNHRISLHIEDSWADIQEKAQNRELDGLAFGGKDPSRAALYNPTNVLMHTYFSVFARSKNEFQLKRFLDLKGMRIGYKKAARPTRSLLEKLPSAILKPYESHETMTQALLQNEIDVIVAWISYDHWRKERLQGTIDNILLIDEYPIEMVSHIRKDWPELVSILNKALLALKKDEVPRITNKWFGEWPNRALREHESQQLAIILPPQEQSWLKEHPEITVGISSSYPPHVIKNTDGTYTGVNIDFYKQISQVLNTKFKLHVEDVWSNVQKKAENREIDGLTIVGRDPNRDLHYNATDIIYPSYFSVFADSREDFQIKRFSDLDGMRIGYKRGARPARTRLEKLPSAIIKPYDDHESMTQALLTNEIDVIVAWMSYDHWRKKTLQGTIDKIYLIKEFPLEMVGYFRKDWPQLIPIVNKAIAVLQKNELPRIIDKWFGEWPHKSEVSAIHLTSEEKAWLAQKNTVRIRVSDAPPWEINTPEPQGMSVDYLTIIGKEFGIDFKFLPGTGAWIDGFNDMAGEHLQYDLLPAANRTEERLEHLAMSVNYLHSPWVVFTRNETSDIYSFDDLRGRKVAVEHGYVMVEKLEKTVPEIELVKSDSTEKALIALSTRKADAYIGNLIVTSYLLQRNGISNLKVSGTTPYGDHSQAMATRKEWAPLITIINKGLKNIPEEDKTSIRNKYLSIRYEHGITIADVMKWILIVTGSTAGIVLFFVIWNKQLSSKVKERTNQLMETESRFRATFEQAAVGVAHVSMEGRFLRVNEKFCDIIGYSEEEMFGLTFQDITHPDDLELDLSNVEQVLKGERENFSLDKRYFRKDGSVIWVNLTVSLLIDRGGNPKYFVSVIKDISERKQAEENLSNSESKYRGLVDNSIVGVFNTNVKGEFLFINKAMVEMYDFDSPEHMLAEGSLSRWADQKQREQMLSALKQHGSVTNFEAESITNTGRHIYVLFSAKILGENIFGMVMDISERKEAEEALKISKSNLIKAQEVGRIGSWNLDLLENRLVWS